MADQNFPGIPAVSGLVPREIAAVLRPMRETLQMFVGGTLPQQGIINGVSRLRRSDLGNSTAFGGGGGPGVDIDYTPPPAPMNLSAAGAIANVILAWDAVPPAAAARVAYTEIYRSQTNDISTATLIGTSQARVYVDNIGAGGTRYYWIRYVSPAPATPPIRGPYNSQTGTAGTTGYDAGYLIDVLSANPPAGSNYSPLFYVQQIATTIGGVPIPAGVYMNMAIIRNLSVTNAMIANLAVDNAKIANLDAAKINAGYIDAARVLVGSLDAKIATTYQKKCRAQ